jgi:hypothetical protein
MPGMRVAICFLFLALTAPARAEWFADLYAGVAYTPRSDVTVVVARPGGSVDHTFHDVKWDNSTAFGARGGYWLAGAPWYGVALDFFQYRADIPIQTVNATIAGAPATVQLQAIDFTATALALDLVRLRYRLFDERLQAYAGAGLAIFEIKLTNRGNGEFTGESGRKSSTGYKVGAGLSWRVATSAAIFGEYRFTHVDSEVPLRGAITGAQVPVRFTLDTHHFVAGVSLSF